MNESALLRAYRGLRPVDGPGPARRPLTADAEGFGRPGLGAASLAVLAPLATDPPLAPIRVLVYVPHHLAIEPWLAWLRGRGWAVHRIGLAAWAHPLQPVASGWLVGFVVAGEPERPWARWVRRGSGRGDRPRSWMPELVR